MEPDKILTWRYNIPITAQSFNTINDDLGNQRKNDEKDGWINDEGCQRVIVLDSFFWTKLEHSIKNGQEISAIRQSKGVDLRKKKIIYFDPTGDGLSDCSDFSLNIRLFLKCRLQDQSVMDHNVWKDVNVDHAVQTDEKSCGIFMLKMAECLAREVQPEFTQDAPGNREKVNRGRTGNENEERWEGRHCGNKYPKEAELF
ncbi:SUMO1 sentrin specific peptidase 1 [Desmophyllum pertusum]|uniref:SUMO1 sentrin specific peptidase 1 n=1 Tax=Desmophyllum pertusum TaxID=174260 RepID=A0A9W9YSL5_9CNID|nr:SUMO1 sentrin specific peptidase 1 [Desmophyllum pertusum]